MVDWFLDPLHSLLQQETTTGGKDSSPAVPLWLVGHSLGGYLTARYALRYADAPPLDDTNLNLEKVVLASPVGFPPRPTNLLTSTQLPTAIRLVDALWSANVTPQQLVRMMGATRGRNAVRRALAGRIPRLKQQGGGHESVNTLDLLADYLFHITVAHPSGEFAMNSLLAPGMSPDITGVFAREPLEPLFEEYGRKKQHKPPGTSTQWKVIFGDTDWMRPNEPSARQAMEYIPKDSSVAVVPNAGHHLYLDNPDDFVRHILN